MARTYTALSPDFEWIIGPKLTETCLPLARQMQATVLREINRQTGANYEVFNPWMSHLSRLPRVRKHFERPNTGEPELDPIFLAQLHEDLKEENGYLAFGFEEGMEIKVDVEVARNESFFVERFRRGRGELFEYCPWVRNLYPDLVKTIIPVRSFAKEKFDRLGASAHATKGALYFMLSDADRPYDRFQIAIDLAHEIAHQVVQVWVSCDRILASSQDAPVYSGARDDVRGALLSFHGAMAHVYESSTAATFLGLPDLDRDSRQFLQFTVLDLRRRLSTTLTELFKHCEFTPLGTKLMGEIDEYVHRLTAFVENNLTGSAAQVVA